MKGNTKNPGWGLYILSLYLILALLSSFIANDKPLICKCDGSWRFPVFADWESDNVLYSESDFSFCTH